MYMAGTSSDQRSARTGDLDGLSTWEQQRRDRIARPSRIAVRALNPQIVKVGDDRVRVSFVQEYQSDTFSDQVNKVLEFKSSSSGWKIVREFIR